MTTNRMGLEQEGRLSDERLKNLASGNARFCIQDDEGQSMSRELLACRAASKKVVTFDQLRDAVAEMTGGIPMDWPNTDKGHQGVPFMNFNSLGRIVDKFRAAPPIQAVPDGWKLVPIEPTEVMVIEGFESEPDKFFSEDEEWEKFEAMSGCEQAAHKAKLCWAAMIAAAPKSVTNEP